MTPNKILFLTIFIFSFAVSCLLLKGTIDQDFFSFYYVGKGVLNGNNMFRDFADNKGPILYLFFALFDIIYFHNYKLVLLFGNAILDTISLYFLFKLINNWYKIPLKKIDAKSILLIFFAVIFYKSFSIGSFMGGIYAETLGMMFVIISLWNYQNNKYFTSGLFFALGVFSRLSILYFIIIFPVIFIIEKKPFYSFTAFIKGFSSASIIILTPFLIDGSIKDLIYNMIIYNLNYAQATRNLQFLSIISQAIIETRIFFTLLFISFFVIFYVLFSKSRKRFIILSIYIASLFVTFPGGIFYYHHFLQFMIITFIVFAFFIQKLPTPITVVLFGIIISSTLLSYILYFKNPQQFFDPQIQELSKKKYLMVIPYYPKYYFRYNKTAPDRYYQQFYLLDFYNKEASFDEKRHEILDKDKVKNTLFMTVEYNVFDTKMKNEYLKKFSRIFHVVKIRSYEQKNARIEIYSSH